MNLVNLKVACFLYNQFTDYDNNYLKFLSRYKSIDLSTIDQVIDLIKWLRSWGCRQFKIEFEDISISSIINWYRVNSLKIPKINNHLIDYNLDKNQDQIIEIFDDLSMREASKKKYRDKTINIRIGPVGTAKTLFALRPNLFSPWDISIYQHFKLDGNGYGYIEYLSKIQKNLKELREESVKSNLDWDNIFTYLNKKHSYYPKLIDEYFWVTITKCCDTAVIEKIFCGKTDLMI